MAYKACFNCELLFEVDAGASEATSVCPECGGPLEDYEPEPDELEGVDLFEEQAPTRMPEDASIVATLAFDGLADKVREKLTARASEQRARPTLESADRPVPVAVPEAAPIQPPAAGPSFPRAGGGATRVLDLEAETGADLMQKTRALEVPVPPPAPAPAPAPAPGPPAEGDSGRLPRRRFGEIGGGESDLARRTRVEQIGDLPPPGPRPVAVPPAARPASPPRRPPAPAAPRAAPIDEAGRPTLHADDFPRRRGAGRGRAAAIVLGVFVVVGGLAFGAWRLLRSDDEPAAAAVDAGAPAAPAWDVALRQQLQDGQATLPVLEGASPLAQTPYVAGGPEGLASSEGVVPGMPSTTVPDSLVDADDDGEWVRALRRSLERGGLDRSQPLAFALHGKVRAATMRRMAYAGYKAGFRTFALGVAAPDGALGSLGFSLHPRSTPLPTTGAVVVRVGRIGFHVTVKDAQGEVVSEGAPNVPRVEGGLDLDGLTARLAALRAAHPDAQAVVLHPNDEMTLDELAPVLARLHGAGGGPTYALVALALR